MYALYGIHLKFKLLEYKNNYNVMSIILYITKVMIMLL